VFLYRFDGRPELVQGWTQDRQAVSRALGAIKPNGGTAIYDTIEQAIPLAERGQNKKKALVIISDGNDTSSHALMSEVQQQIRQSEVLVYAVGIDASDNADYSSRSPSKGSSKGSSSSGSSSSGSSSGPSAPTGPRPQPSPFPGAKTPPPTTYSPAPPPPPPPPSNRNTSTSRRSNSSIDRVNPDALHAITDDSGGRTEIVVSPRDLDPATAGIADELSRQYFIGYVSTQPKDGKWHTIEVRLKKGNYLVRARKGYFAS
jgi:VWFA-related protein